MPKIFSEWFIDDKNGPKAIKIVFKTSKFSKDTHNGPKILQKSPKWFIESLKNPKVLKMFFNPQFTNKNDSQFTKIDF